jgi:hypothetical protein
LSKTNLNKSNLSKSNLDKSNLSKSNVTDHSLKNAGQEKNLNSHATPLKNASDPKNFGARRDFANKTAFNSFWREGWHDNWWHHNHFFHIGWIGPLIWPFAYAISFISRCGPGITGGTIRSGLTAMATSTKPSSSPTAMAIT